MSNYIKTTNFATKDSLPSGNPAKIVKGTEINTEFDNIAVASGTKADKASPVFTGTVTLPATNADSLSIGGDGVTVTGIKDEDDMASNSATKLASQQSIKAYVDSQVTAQDLDVTDGTTSISIDLDSEALSLLGGTGVTSTASGNGVTMAIDSTVATLTGTQTLTNKTLTTPVISGNLTTDGNIDGRDVATDGTKLDTVETNADVTDTTNVTAAGALMDSEVTNLAQVKAFDSTDYATAAQGTTADAALPKAGGAMTGAITTNSTFDGRDVATDGTKLDGIEALADVTDATNVTAAGALMDSEVTNLAQVKAFDSSDYATAAQGTTADSALQDVVDDTTPQLGGDLDTNGNDVKFADNDKATFGAGDDLQIYHDGTHSVIEDFGTGNLILQSNGAQVSLQSTTELYLTAANNGAVTAYHNGSPKLATTSTGIDVTGTATMDGLTVDGNVESLGTFILNNGTDKWQNFFSTNDLIIRNNHNTSWYNRLRISYDGDISFYEDTGTTPKLFWDASAESLGIGTSSPASYGHSLVIAKDAAGGATYATITNTNANQFLNLGINADVAEITWDNNDSLAFGTTAASTDEGQTFEAMRIDASGNLLVGKTATSFGTAGIAASASIGLWSTRSGFPSASFNRLGSDGAITEFFKDGTTVGSIGSFASGNYLYIGSGDTGLVFAPNIDAIIPYSTTGSNYNGNVDLGYGDGTRFRDLYLSGGVYLGGTGAANKLDDYEEGTWTPALGGTWTTNPTNLSGTYTKVGRIVYITVTMTGGVKSSQVSGYLTGVPINIANGTGSVSDSSVADFGNCLFQNSNRVWLTATNLGTGTVYITGTYLAA